MPREGSLSLIHRPCCAGVDEAGRGPLAGPVVAAAVILESVPTGLNDSKKLSEQARNELVPKIKAHSVSWSIGLAEAEEIDRLNILNATFVAMQRAVAGLSVDPERLLIDGNRAPEFHKADGALATETHIGGDAHYAAIAAASVLAKVHRDTLMVELHQSYPDYGFARHKGYPTKLHREHLQSLGPCPAHRRSFAPVQRALNVGKRA